MLVTRIAQAEPRLAERLDPGYHHPAYEALIGRARVPLVRFGEWIAELRYGPIVTGPGPEPVSEGVTVIHQGQVGETGVDPRGATLVPEGSAWDAPRARLQPEDIVLPRSGVASVAKNRVAVFLGDYPAVVGSFVDLIRVTGADPFFVLCCLKTELAWAQIHRAINGVGTPNISFDEIRALLLPELPPEAQQAVREEYLSGVHPLHLAWLDGDASAREEGRTQLLAIVDRLNGMIFEP